MLANLVPSLYHSTQRPGSGFANDFENCPDQGHLKMAARSEDTELTDLKTTNISKHKKWRTLEMESITQASRQMPNQK